MALRDDGLRLALKWRDTSGKLHTVRTRSKRRILNYIQATPAVEVEKWWLSVQYVIPGEDVFNRGTYESKKDLVFAYNAFTAKEEVDFVREYWT